MMRMIFLGSDPIALPLLEWLSARCRGRVAICGVITSPDRPRGRGKQTTAGPIKQWALQAGVEVRQPEKPGAEVVEWIQTNGIDLALVMAYGYLLQRMHLKAPLRGCWNLHGSILPRFRGASPVETALAEGERETGVSLMKMVRRMDAGPVAGIERIPIRQTDTAESLRRRIGEACIPLMERLLDPFLEGKLPLQEQSEEEASYCRRLTKEDGCLDFSLPAEILERRVRACQPWPGAYFDLGQARIRVMVAEVFPSDPAADVPGLMQKAHGAHPLRIATGRGWFCPMILQRPGGRPLPVAEFLRGYALPDGRRLPLVPSRPWLSDKPFRP